MGRCGELGGRHMLDHRRLDADPDFGEASAGLLDSMMNKGLVICPVSYVELAPAFLGDRKRQDEFLSAIGIDIAEGWTFSDTYSAHRAWARQIELKRQSRVVKRPVADILIGAYAEVRTGLLTRNLADFRSVFPELTIRCPSLA